jgi:hypothetical protein
MPISAILPMANPALELSQVRSMQLAQAPAAAAPTAAPVASASLPAEGSDASAQAAAGAANVAPPAPMKTILGSVLRGAMSGASLAFGLNSFGSKIPGVGPFLAKAIGVIPFIGKMGFPMPIFVALGVGAVVGGVFGLLSGMRKVKKQAAAYVQAQAAASAAAAEVPADGGQSPIAPGMPDVSPVAAPPKRKKKRKVKRNPVMGASRSGKHPGSRRAKKLGGGESVSAHHIVRGDTLSAISQRYGVSIDSIMKENRDIIQDANLIYAGDTIAIPT